MCVNEDCVIEEMAKIICQDSSNEGKCEKCGFYENRSCRKFKEAEALYNADYRKQSVGEWVDQYNGKYDNPIYVCSACRRGTLLKPDINELGNMQMIQALSLFCPNCGSRMKGGAE